MTSTSTTCTRWVLVLLLGLSLSLSLLPANAAQLDPDERIDLDLKSASLVETLQSFAQISGSRLDLDPSIEGSVTVTLRATPWRQVLDQICIEHQLNCEILSDRPNVLRVRPVQRAAGAAAQPGYFEAIDMSLRSANLRQTLQAFGTIGDREIILDDNVTGTVTIEIRAAPWSVILEEICDLSGCWIEWGDSALQVHATEAAAPTRRANWRFADTSLAEALVTVAALPIFGALGEPEITIAEAFDPALTLDLEDASWLDALNAVCKAAACQWSLTYGAPSRIAVDPIDPGLEQSVELPVEPLPFDQAAGHLARALALEIEIKPGLAAQTEVRFTDAQMIWKDAISELCDQAGCFWSTYGKKLLLRPKVKTLSERPTSDATNRRFNVRFVPPSPATPVEGTARFNWTAPIQTFASPETELWWTRLSWIPFGHELHLVVPTLGRCGPGGAVDVQLLEPIKAPFDEPQRRAAHGATVELSNPTEEDEDTVSTRRATPCSTEPGGRIQVTFRTTESSGSNESTLDLPGRVGTYLLITPPGTEQPSPMAAILALGENADGGQNIVLVKPAHQGATVDLIHRTLPVDDTLVETLRTSDGRTFELALRYRP